MLAVSETVVNTLAAIAAVLVIGLFGLLFTWLKDRLDHQDVQVQQVHVMVNTRLTDALLNVALIKLKLAQVTGDSVGAGEAADEVAAIRRQMAQSAEMVGTKPPSSPPMPPSLVPLNPNIMPDENLAAVEAAEASARLVVATAAAKARQMVADAQSKASDIVVAAQGSPDDERIDEPPFPPPAKETP